MSDRFDFLEIGEGRRSLVRRLGADEWTGNEVSMPVRTPTVAVPLPRPAAPEAPEPWRVVETIGGMGSDAGEFHSPQGLAVDRLGNLYVADTGNHRVQRIALDGGVAVLDRSHGAPREPVGVAVDEDLTFYVINPHEPGLIHAFAADGALLWQWRAPGFRLPEMQSASVLAVDRRTLVLLDTQQGRILRIRIPETGRQPSVLEEIRHPALPHPRGVCTDGRGSLIVAEASRPEVVALQSTADGVWQAAWRRDLTEAGLADWASVFDLAADRDGRVFAALPHAGYCVSSPENERPRRLDLQGMPDEPPSGSLAVGPDGSLYVASFSHRIYRLKPAT